MNILRYYMIAKALEPKPKRDHSSVGIATVVFYIVWIIGGILTFTFSKTDGNLYGLFFGGLVYAVIAVFLIYVVTIIMRLVNFIVRKKQDMRRNKLNINNFLISRKKVTS